MCCDLEYVIFMIYTANDFQLTCLNKFTYSLWHVDNTIGKPYCALKDTEC